MKQRMAKDLKMGFCIEDDFFSPFMLFFLLIKDSCL